MYFDKTADQLLQCIICGQASTRNCMRCHKAYCSKACQRLDWDGVGSTSTKQKAQANQKAGSKERYGLPYGDHKVICKKLAGSNDAALVQRLRTPPPRPPTLPSRTGLRGDQCRNQTFF